MMKCTHLSNLVHNGVFLPVFLFFHYKEGLSLVSPSNLFSHSMPTWRKWLKEEKIRIPAEQEYGQWNSSQWQQGTDSLLFFPLGHKTFPRSFLQSCFESPCLRATKRTMPGAQVREFPTFLMGCTCPTGSLVFDPWFNSENTSAEVLETPSSFLPVCCHLGIVWMSSKPLQLQLGHLCSGTAMLLVARKWLFIYLPVTFSTGLFYLISALPAVQIFFPHHVPFPPRCWWVSSTLPWCCWQVTELTKCFSQQPLTPAESAPHRAALPKTPSSLWTSGRSGSWGWILAQVPSITAQQEPRWAVKLADDAALNSR